MADISRLNINSLQLKGLLPRWTVIYNISSNGGFVGKGWEFFTNEQDAVRRYEELNCNPDRYCATIRPYHHITDYEQLGAIHQVRLEQYLRKQNFI